MLEQLVLNVEPEVAIVDFMLHEEGNRPFGLDPRHAAYPGHGLFIGHYQIRSPSGHNRHIWHSFSSYKRTARHSVGSARVSVPVIPEQFPDSCAQQWCGEYPDYWSMANTVAGTMSADGVNSTLPEMYSINPSDGSLVIAGPPGLDALLQNAINGMMPGIKAQLSLYNSLYELKDFAHFGSTVSHLLDTLRRIGLYRSVKGIALQDYAKQMTMREISRRGSDTYLQYMFNLHPLYSDIVGFIKSIMSYKRQLKRLIDNAEKLQRRHYVAPVPPFGEDGTFVSDPMIRQGVSQDGQTSYFSPAFSYMVKQQTIHVAPKFHVEIQYSYSLSELSLRHAELNALLDSLGINNNLGIIWAALPWSFIVDWFVQVQAYFNRNRTRMMEPVVCIRRALWSIEYERTTLSHIYIQGSGWHPASEVNEKAYCRLLFQPTTDSLKESGLTATQLSLGAALLFSRNKRH